LIRAGLAVELIGAEIAFPRLRTGVRLRVREYRQGEQDKSNQKLFMHVGVSWSLILTNFCYNQWKMKNTTSLALFMVLSSAFIQPAVADQCVDSGPAGRPYCVCSCPGSDKDGESCVKFRGRFCCRQGCDAQWAPMRTESPPGFKYMGDLCSKLAPASVRARCGPCVVLDPANPSTYTEYMKYMSCIQGGQ
jgi:hypothetical protein